MNKIIMDYLIFLYDLIKTFNDEVIYPHLKDD